MLLADPRPALVRHGVVAAAASAPRVSGAGDVFVATKESHGGFIGLNTHLMLIRPDAELAELIDANAAEGHFIPYTLTEQDALESMLTPRVPSPKAA